LAVTVIAGLRLAAEAQTVWESAEDGVWSDAEAWSAGVPDANAAFLTNNSASYTVTVDAQPATPYGNLTLANAAGNTTRLDVAAAGFVSTNGALSIGRGATVAVNAGGVMGYAGRTSATPFVEVKDGGVWRVDGGPWISRGCGGPRRPVATAISMSATVQPAAWRSRPGRFCSKGSNRRKRPIGRLSCGWGTERAELASW